MHYRINYRIIIALNQHIKLNMEEKDVEKSKPKYHHKYNNNNKRIENLEDLCHLLRNKTNQLYGDDQLMITMVTRLIEGKDAVDISKITLPAAVI